MKVLKRTLYIVATTLLIGWLVLPESPIIPVEGADARDWHRETFWYEPWGRSEVHKGIDIFAPMNTAVLAPTYGVITYAGETPIGGEVVTLLGRKWRIHYFAHLNDYSVSPGRPVRKGLKLGAVGNSGNAEGKPPHLHYAVISLLPYVWLADDATQGWKKMFFLDPNRILGTVD